MRSIGKILARYLASAAGIVLLLFIINTSVLLGWVVQSSRAPQLEYRIRDIAAGLRAQDGGYALDAESQEALASRYAWAMLLDDRGDAVWSWQLPEDVPVHYTVPEVASFTRWYLNDYPVYAWRHPAGLLVLGSSKDSMWKGSLELPMQAARQAPAWLIAALVLNIGAAIGLAVLLSFRLFRSLRQLAGGIEGLADKAAAEVPVQGPLGELAENINRASEKLRRQDAALEERDAARARWIAGVSHDIRTPLTMVMGYAGELEEDRALPERARRSAGVIRGQSERIRELVQDLNLACKLEYDMQPVDMQPLCLAELLREIAAEVVNAQTHARYTVRLDIQQGGQGLTVAADARLLGRALHNLVGNSIRHNPEGCSVTIRLARCGERWEIQVEDDGRGFPQEVCEGKRTHGMGLSLVEQILRVHGGAVRFENLPHGCRASLMLPV